MSKFPTCDVCSKNLTNPPKILMTSDMDEIYHCSECQIIICAECEEIFLYKIFDSESEEDHCYRHRVNDNLMKRCNREEVRHNFERFTICQYCGKVADGYDHIEIVHHYIKCKECNIIMKDRKEQMKHLYGNQSCLDCYLNFNGHISLIKMLMTNMQTLQKEINELKRHSKNKKSRNFKTDQINQCDEKSLREELYSKHNSDDKYDYDLSIIGPEELLHEIDTEFSP